MSCEDALLVADYERDDGTDTTVSEMNVRMNDIVGSVLSVH